MEKNQIKICTKCKRELPATKEYRYKSKTSKDGWYSSCKECKNRAVKEYEHTDEYRRKHSRYVTERYKSYLISHRREMGYNRIHKRTKRMIDKTIGRPTICPICGNETKIIAHHPDYSKWYEIVFCCTQCHDKIHKGKNTDYKIINLLEMGCRQVDTKRTAVKSSK